MHDLIKLTDIKVMGKHGANEGERDKEQMFHVSVELHLNLHKPQATDVLADTLDYKALHDKIVAIVKTKSFCLLERLAGEIINTIFTDGRVVQAQVSVAKPGRLDGCTPVVVLNRVNSGPW